LRIEIVSMMIREKFIDNLEAGAAAMGIRLEGKILEQFYRYFSELSRWNARVNLVSRQEPDWIRVHFLDSLASLSIGLVVKEGRMVDLGAGAGFPGVPLKLANPGLSLDLAEASGKKCVWLRHLLRILGLEESAVLEGRFERLLEEGCGGAYDLAVSRAAARPGKMLEEARPFLRPGGKLLVSTTEDLTENGVGKVHRYTIPGSTASSVIWEVNRNEM